MTLTLFGLANDWLPAAVEAMTAALSDVDWAGQTGLFATRADILGRRLTETTGIAPPPPAESFSLDFVSPLALTGADPREKPASLFTGFGLRLEALARWHDVSLGEAVGRPALAELARTLEFRFGDCDSVRWTRGSKRQDRSIPMLGIVGRLEIGGPGTSMGDAGAMLAMGATCHMGADTAFGCGRYALGLTALPGTGE